MSRKVPTTIRGVTYNSRTEAAEAMGITAQAITLAIRHNRLDQVGLNINRCEQSGKAVSKPFHYKELHFPSLRAAAKAIGMSDSWFSTVVRKGTYAQQVAIARRFERLREQKRMERYKTAGEMGALGGGPGANGQSITGNIPPKKSCAVPSNMK